MTARSENTANKPSPPTIRTTATARPRGLGGWPGIVVLAAVIAQTAIVILYYVAPSAFGPTGTNARYGYVFFGSIVVSIAGGLALTIRQNNPWWLLTLPWAVGIGIAIALLAGATGIASMH